MTRYRVQAKDMTCFTTKKQAALKGETEKRRPERLTTEKNKRIVDVREQN